LFKFIYSNSNNILAKYIYLNKLNLTEIESKQLKRKIEIESENYINTTSDIIEPLLKYIEIIDK